MDEPNIDPDDLERLRADITAMRAKPERFMELRGLALQLIDDLSGAYDRLSVMYDRYDKITDDRVTP